MSNDQLISKTNDPLIFCNVVCTETKYLPNCNYTPSFLFSYHAVCFFQSVCFFHSSHSVLSLFFPSFSFPLSFNLQSLSTPSTHITLATRSNHGVNIEGGDRQRLISTLTTRSLSNHHGSGGSGGKTNGVLLNNLPKSSSNITFLSDEHPVTTHNPLYADDGTLSSPGAEGKAQRRRDLLGTHSPQRRRLKGVLSRFPLPNDTRSGHAWTLPSRLRGGNAYEALRRKAALSRGSGGHWEPQLKRSRGRDAGMNELAGGGGGGGGGIGPKLSVKEQARQFEQQALQDAKQRQNRDSRGSLDFLLTTHDKGPAPPPPPPSHPPPMSPGPPDGPPAIVVTQIDGSSPPPSHKPTPPALRKFRASFGAEVEPYSVTVEIIPDPPDVPPPPPPTPPPPNQPPPSPPTSPSIVSYITPPQSPPQSSPHPPPPPPPPLPPPSNSPNPSVPLVASPFVLPPLPAITTLRPVSLRPPPPPLATQEPEAPRRELKGILKNIKNIADIEKSVANMYSQIDKKQRPPKHVPRSQTMEVETGEAAAAVVAAEPGVEGDGAAELAAEAEDPAEAIAVLPPPNPNMDSIVEELEKRFPSQSTSL